MSNDCSLSLGFAKASGQSCVQCDRVDPFVSGVWDSYVMARPDHSVFHTSAWARVLSDSYAHRPFYLRIIVEGEEAALVPLMQVHSSLTGLRGVSVPFADFAGVLWIDSRHKAAVYQVLQEVAVERKWKHLELRCRAVSAPGVCLCGTYHAHELDLSCGISQLARQLPMSTRRSIHKAERSGLAITIGRDPHAMQAFYHLHSRTRRRHGLPPQPIKFFQAISRHLMEMGMGEIVLAHHAGEAVAG
ncbi:MAG: hypothetical protein RLZZ282_1428, partial [Verrucomicrobiota bacterium]